MASPSVSGTERSDRNAQLSPAAVSADQLDVMFQHPLINVYLLQSCSQHTIQKLNRRIQDHTPSSSLTKPT